MLGHVSNDPRRTAWIGLQILLIACPVALALNYWIGQGSPAAAFVFVGAGLLLALVAVLPVLVRLFGSAN